MLLKIVIGDAYGAGFEDVSQAIIADVSGFRSSHTMQR